MQKNNIMPNIHIYVKISFVCIFLLLLISCKEDIKIEKYYYEVYTDMDTILYSYSATKIIDSNDVRKQITYRYNDIEKKIVRKSIEYYRLNGKNMFLLKNNTDSGKLFLSAEHIDSCITYSYGDELYDQVAAITHCFLGENKLKVSEDNYIESYEFYKIHGLGGMGSVKYKVFYDKSFVPIRTERTAGYSPIDTIIRTDSIPFEFKILLNQEHEWVQ